MKLLSGKKVVTYICISFVLAACQKSEKAAPQPDKVVIDIQAPYAGQMFRKGDTVHINADISYISQLHGYLLNIKNQDNGETVYSSEGHTHGDKISIRETWVDTISVQAMLLLEISAVIDHDAHESNATQLFKSQP